MMEVPTKREPVNKFINDIEKALSERNFSAALTTISDNKYDTELHKTVWDLIPIMVNYLSEDNYLANEELYKCSKEILNIITKKCDQEEVLLQMIEEVETAKDNVMFLTVLDIMKNNLLNLPKKRITSLIWALNAIQSYLDRLQPPDNLNLNKEEAILMDADPTVDKISHLYVDLTAFYDSFITTIENWEGDSLETRKKIVSKFLLRLLGKPLIFLDMSVNQQTKSRGRRIAETIIEKIIFLTPDLYVFLDREYDKNDDVIQVGKLALGDCFYLIECEMVSSGCIPQVYNPIYKFQNCLNFIPELFNYDNQFVVDKGLLLIESLLNNLKGVKLSYLILDSEAHSRFCKNLSNVIIHHELKAHRKKALDILHSYLFQFENKGRYLLIYNLTNILKHAGIISFLITEYKNMLVEEFNNQIVTTFFKDEKLFTILSMFCYLNKREESDLVELSDRIVASLNLLRYLIMRDKRNDTKIWNYLNVLETNFLEPLKKGLVLSKAHYELKLKELKTDTKINKQAEFSVKVAGQNLPDMQLNDKLQALNLSLTAFDVMEGLLCRLNEIIEVGPSSNC